LVNEINVQGIIRDYERLKSDRVNWNNLWQDVSDFVLPSREFNSISRPGERRRQKIFDSTAPDAAETLSSAVHGMLFNPASIWFSLQMEDQDLNDNEEVRLWLDTVVLQMLNLFNSQSVGFNTQSYEIMQDLVSFGTGCLIDRTRTGRVNFTATPLDNIYIKSDSSTNHINTAYREIEWTPNEVIAEFGKNNVSKNIVDAATDPHSNQANKKSVYLHAVFQRDARDASRRDVFNKQFASVYVDLANKVVLSESGMDEFPYIIPRWNKAVGETYGRSPAIKMLAEIMTVNAMTRTVLVAGEKAVSPPLQVMANMFKGKISTRPNSINYVKPSAGGDVIKPIQTGNNVQLGEAMIQSRQEKIMRGFYLHLLELPQNDRMTAVEVTIRTQQRMQIFSPVVARLGSELLQPLVIRTFRAMLATGALLPPPAVINGRNMFVEFVSPLGVSQRASSLGALQQHMSINFAFADTNPEILDNYNTDSIHRDSAALLNVPQRYLNQVATVAQIRQVRNQAMQQREALEQAEQASKAAKNVGGLSLAG